MSRYNTDVTHVEIETEDYGLRARITIQRVPGSTFIAADPQVSDLPPDVREALLKWLDAYS